MSRLESLASLVASQGLWGKLQNLFSLKVSKQAVMSFYVAGVALRDISPSFQTCQTWFCVAGAILLRRFQKMRCIFCGRSSTLETSDVIVGGRSSTFHVSCCVSFANRIVRDDAHHSILYTLHSTLYTPDFTLYTLQAQFPHLTLDTLHSTLSTLHSTLHTFHFTLHTFTNISHFTLYTPHLILHT